MPSERFAEKLKELMEYENLSIRALSIRINVDRRSLRLWLEGEFYPRYDALIKLSRYFNIGIDYLLGIGNEVAAEEKVKYVSDCLCDRAFFSAVSEDQSNELNRKHVEIDDVANYFSVKLRAKKEERKLTVYAISKMLNVDAKSVSKWFTGTSVPETVNLIKLSKMFQISVSELLGQ